MLVCLLVSQQSVAENRRSELRAGIQALLKDGNSSEPVKRPHVRPARGRSVCQSRKRGVLISRRLPVSFLLIIMVALCNRADHYIFMLWFVLSSSSFFFFSSPNLSRRRLDVCHCFLSIFVALRYVILLAASQH